MPTACFFFIVQKYSCHGKGMFSVGFVQKLIELLLKRVIVIFVFAPVVFFELPE